MGSLARPWLVQVRPSLPALAQGEGIPRVGQYTFPVLPRCEHDFGWRTRRRSRARDGAAKPHWKNGMRGQFEVVSGKEATAPPRNMTERDPEQIILFADRPFR